MVEIIVDKRGSPQFGGQEEQCMIRKKLQREKEVAVVERERERGERGSGK